VAQCCFRIVSGMRREYGLGAIIIGLGWRYYYLLASQLNYSPTPYISSTDTIDDSVKRLAAEEGSRGIISVVISGYIWACIVVKLPKVGQT
jgi:hypothetical protein